MYHASSGIGIHGTAYPGPRPVDIRPGEQIVPCLTLSSLISVALIVCLSTGTIKFGFHCVDCAVGTFSAGREGHCRLWTK